MADMADIDQVEECWDVLAERDRHRARRADHLHELLGRAEGVRRPQRRRGVHVVERAGRARVGVRSAATARRSCSSPTSTSAATPATRWATTSRTCGSGTRTRSSAASTSARSRKRRSCCGAGGARCTSASPPTTCAEFRADAPRRRGDRAPRVQARGGRARRPRRRRPSASSSGPTDAPPGAVIGVGTEIHMMQRMAEEMPDKTIVSLDPLVCPCSTMFRIDEPHLAWCLEIARGAVRS